MNEKERLIKQIEKTKKAIKDLDDHINKINELLSHYDDVSIDELPTEFQNSIMDLMKTKTRLIQQRLSGQALVTKCELLLKIGEQF